jgi:hypothetical protein
MAASAGLLAKAGKLSIEYYRGTGIENAPANNHLPGKANSCRPAGASELTA